MKGRNADKTKISEVCTYVSRYKRRITSNNLLQKKVSGYILVEEKEREMEVGNNKVLEAF